jgi:glycosyltransferase involved in cell wall biosynthesis
MKQKIDTPVNIVPENNILVTVLAYNEGASIEAVINRIKRILPEATIAVINDGSSDDTSEVARRTGIEVIDLPFNLGIGGAMQTGLKFGLIQNFEYIVRMDGDGQHPPEEIPKLLDPVMHGEADIAVGTRFSGPDTFGYKASLPRRIGIYLFSRLASRYSGREVTDATCSFQVLNAKAAKFLDNNMEQDHPEVDGWILLGRAGYTVKEIPVGIEPRRKGASSINQWRALYFIIKVGLTALAARSRRFNE